MSESLSPSTPSVQPQAQPPAQPAQQKASNGLGVASMVLGIVTMAGFAIPILNTVGIIIGIVGLVLGIIGLVIKFKPRKAAIAGVILSGLGLILSIILVAVYTAAVVGAVNAGNEATLPSTSEQQSSPEQEQPAGADGTRESPFPIGTKVKNDEWEVTINSVTFGANDAVAAANQFNEAPDEGNEYMLINATMTYIGNDSDGGMPAFVGIDYVTADGVTVDSLGTFAVAPDALDSLSTLYNGGSITGNMVIQVPSENATQGVLAVRPGMLAEKTFVAVQ